MQKIYFYSARFPLEYVSKEAPDTIKNAYSDIMQVFNIHTKEVSIDKEDWIESVIPLISIFKVIDIEDIFIYGKLNNQNFNSFYNKRDLSLNYKIVLIGYFLQEENIKELFTNSESKILFPDIRKDFYIEKNYFKLNAFIKNAHRKIYGPASTVYKEHNLFFEQLLNYINSGECSEDNKENFDLLIESDDFNKEKVLSIVEDNKYCEENSLEKFLTEISSKNPHIKQFFIKTLKKKWAHTLDIKPNSTKKDIISALIDLFGYEYTERTNTIKDYILVQSHAEIEYEYRFIVIDNELICGSGCIEYFTPANSIGMQFDIQIEQKRNNGLVEMNQKLISKMAKKAAEIVLEIKNENPEFKNYTLDMGIINGEIGIIEINPYQNIGLYALNYDFISRKLISL